MDTLWLWSIPLVFLAAGAVKGVSGMGLPTFSMALLGLFMPATTAATLMLLPSLLTNVAQCIGPHAGDLWRRLWPMWLGLVAATLWSPLPDLASTGTTARATLGAVLVVYGLWGLVKPALPQPGRFALPAGSLAGMLSGVLTAATGVFVMPMTPFLQSLRMEKDALIQALGLSFLLATLALAARLGPVALWGGSALPLTAHALALLAAFAGLWLGARWRQRLPLPVFQRALFAVFTALGLLMLARAM
ncbi:sulfite exporter TauE/SafE family protein [Hydrogenophaga sp. BPS33]|uniref:sulfite exporter TauE/SafE family protein n=1 Tax=Hydrogenophaga sp. BPS33 TaxID=2651974 RepID=UPI00131FD226|nr:sulfite exporter TauE/SafE family protein [Hydrogenophaga sp. BPS33]QHE83677.1 sulfite exporter TauE/SafE family protein [Hydrogenophaga sp. BPS33]